MFEIELPKSTEKSTEKPLGKLPEKIQIPPGSLGNSATLTIPSLSPRFFSLRWPLVATSSCWNCQLRQESRNDLKEDWPFELQWQLESFDRGDFKAIKLPCHALESHAFDTVVRAIGNRPIWLEIHPQSEISEKLQKLLNPDSSLVGISLLLHRPLSIFEQSLWSSLSTVVRESEIIFIPNKKWAPEDTLLSLPRPRRNRICLYFPFHRGVNLNFFSDLEIGQVVWRLQRHFPDTDFISPNGFDIYEPKLGTVFLESHFEPTWKNSIGGSKIQFSIVIPTYNKSLQLLCTLRHLTEQSLPSKNFEILIVDDGSTDGTLDFIRNELPNLLRHNLRYFYFPRQSTDSLFRAGLCRNLGAKHATGEYLLFLDDDVLLPRTYLHDLADLHLRWDVVQGQRWDLRSGVSSPSVQYSSIDPKSHLRLQGGNHWKHFYSRRKQWNQWPDSWKYICTHSLSLRRKDFQALGGFRRTFCVYGYEDTELGYRLHQSGKKFFLTEKPVYHLISNEEFSNQKNSRNWRRSRLGTSISTFLHNQPSISVFNHSLWILGHGFERKWKALPKISSTFEEWGGIKGAKLTIVIPTRGDDLRVLDCIQSISKQIFPKQELELLVVSNTANSSLKSHLKSRRLTLPGLNVLTTHRKGANIARNAGLGRSQGEIIVFLDDDSFLHDRFYLQKIVQVHDSFPECLAIGGSYTPESHANAVDIAYCEIAKKWVQHGNLLGGNLSFKRKIRDLGLEFHPALEWGHTETELQRRLENSGYSYKFVEFLSVEHRCRLKLRQLIQKAWLQGYRGYRLGLVAPSLPGFFWPSENGHARVDPAISRRIWAFDYFFYVGILTGKFLESPTVQSFLGSAKSLFLKSSPMTSQSRWVQQLATRWVQQLAKVTGFHFIWAGISKVYYFSKYQYQKRILRDLGNQDETQN